MAGVFEARIRVEGLKQLQNSLHRAGARALVVARAELTKQTALTLARAQQLAPLDTGLLRKNVRVEKTVVVQRKRSITGKTLPAFLRGSFTFRQRYAEQQHENLSFRHQDGENKYAEKAIRQRLRQVIATVAFKLRQAL